MVKRGYEELGEHPTDAQRSTMKNSKKKDCKAIFYIHHNVDTNNFEKISKVSTSNEAWNILVKNHTCEKSQESEVAVINNKIWVVAHGRRRKDSKLLLKVAHSCQMKSCW